MYSAPEEFTIQVSRRQDATVLTLRGDLDLASAEGLSASLATHRDAGEPVSYTHLTLPTICSV